MIILGSQSKDKLKILEEYLKRAGIDNYRIQQTQAESGVSSQPLSKAETTLGAKNRARNAYSLEAGGISIGLEGGVFKKSGLYNLICTASIYDGIRFYDGSSQPIPLPVSVSESIERGDEFGIVIRKYAEDFPNSKEDVQEIISRYDSFSLAIDRAFSKIPNKALLTTLHQ